MKANRNAIDIEIDPACCHLVLDRVRSGERNFFNNNKKKKFKKKRNVNFK